MGISRMSVHRILNNAAWRTKPPNSHSLINLSYRACMGRSVRLVRPLDS
jgi:hypothetical protein